MIKEIDDLDLVHPLVSTLETRRPLHRRLRLCPTSVFPPAAADLFISSSNPAPMRIHSTSSRIGLYSAAHGDKEVQTQFTRRTRGKEDQVKRAHRTALLQERTHPFEGVFHGCRWYRMLFVSSVRLGVRQKHQGNDLEPEQYDLRDLA